MVPRGAPKKKTFSPLLAMRPGSICVRLSRRTAARCMHFACRISTEAEKHAFHARFRPAANQNLETKSGHRSMYSPSAFQKIVHRDPSAIEHNKPTNNISRGSRVRFCSRTCSPIFDLKSATTRNQSGHSRKQNKRRRNYSRYEINKEAEIDVFATDGKGKFRSYSCSP